MPESHLLATKLMFPPVRATLLQRLHLIERLNQSRSLPVILLSASAGFGKTTLLAAWVSQSTSCVAWLSLDEQDNDLTRFWVAVIVALRTRLPDACEGAFALLQSPQPPNPTTILTVLINELTALAEETTLILDDYHVIEEQAIHESVVFLLDHLPPSLHLVLSSRVDPPVALSRWRARGQLVEIRDADLRLSQEEAASFLRQAMGLRLEEEDVVQLAQRTEGWIAGLQLAALSLRGREDPSTLVRAFSGSHRFILDYVQEDILQRQSPAIQQFLLQTAVLAQMNAALCRAVTGEQASQELLEGLERANLFLVPLDGERQWYRFHLLFREALLARLQAMQPEQLPLLHRRAAAWYETQGLLHEAIPHALAAEDFAHAADLIERFLVPQSWHNEYHLLRRWVACLPEEVLRTRPDLSLSSVIATILTSRRGPHTLELVEGPLQMAEYGFRSQNNQARLGAVLAVRAVLTSFQGAFAQAFALARQALALLPEAERQWRGHALSLRGTEEAIAGQLTRARQFLLQGLALYETSGSLPGKQFALGMLGEVCLSRGELHLAARYFQQALASSDERQVLTRLQLTLETGARETYYERLAFYGRASLAYEWNDLKAAQQYLHEALQGPSEWIHLLTPGWLLQPHLFLACGEGKQAREILEERVVQDSRPEVLRELHLCRAWLALKMGDLDQVEQWAAIKRQGVEPLALTRREEEVLLLARLRIAEGRPHEALDVLTHWRQEARAEERRHSALHILVLEALAYEASDMRDPAAETLQQALTQARSEGYQRLFLDEGPIMESLLKSLLPSIQEEALAAYVQTLLHSFARTTAHPQLSPTEDASLPFSPLTPQERRVLQLLAEGATNQAIADQLVVSLATAKKHVANILSKLGAENRTQAIARARENALF